MDSGRAGAGLRKRILPACARKHQERDEDGGHRQDRRQCQAISMRTSWPSREWVRHCCGKESIQYAKRCRPPLGRNPEFMVVWLTLKCGFKGHGQPDASYLPGRIYGGRLAPISGAEKLSAQRGNFSWCLGWPACGGALGTVFAVRVFAVGKGGSRSRRGAFRGRKGRKTMGQVLHVFSIGRIRRLSVPLMIATALASSSLPAMAQIISMDTEPDRAAAHPQPLDVIRSSVTRVLAAAGSGQQRVAARRVAEELFDFDEMSRRMLADHWQEISPRQQGEFVRLFTELIEQSYLRGLRHVPPAAITFLGETVNGSYAQVTSSIATSRFGETSVEYRLMDRDGRWAVYDVVLDGVSLVSSYRSQFTSILRTSSFAQLLEKLRSREPADSRNEQGP